MYDANNRIIIKYESRINIINTKYESSKSCHIKMLHKKSMCKQTHE